MNTLCSRFSQERQLADLDRAIAVGRDLAATTPLEHPEHALVRSNLSVALGLRYEHTDERRDLDEAIGHYRAAVDGSRADDPFVPNYLSNLGAMLRERYRLTEQPADLDEAVALGRRSLALAPRHHPDRHRYLNNHATVLRARYDGLGDPADLDDAVARFEEALAATSDDHPNRTAYLVNLASALHARHGVTGDPDDRRVAVGMLRAAADVPTAPPTERVLAARDGGQAAVEGGDAESALAAYTTAIHLLPLAAWHGLDRPAREDQLREWVGLSSAAASAAVAAGEPERAVELLEAGRSVLWTQALQLRQDLSDVRDRDPGLADALAAASTVLAEPVAPPGNRPATGVGVTPVDLDRRRRAARDWDDAVTRVRELAGFEHFLAPAPFSALRAAADGGPVVVVLAGLHGSHALVLTPTSTTVQVVDLPDADVHAMIEQVELLLGALHGDGGPAGRQAVLDVLDWTWRAVAEPVLDHLGHTRSGHERPRIWWCPAGPAVRLPLHAAGRRPGPDGSRVDTVAGRVVSSYTPTLTSLIRARARRPRADGTRLDVGVPGAPAYAPGASALPGVVAEMEVLARHPAARTTRLVGPAATRDAVLDALPDHSRLHLSCHGIQHGSDANRSAFLLHDRPLTLADLAALRMPDADLAYLAACQTATGDLTLIDEARHLAAGLQAVGYRHVLASMWTIADADAVRMAESIYTRLDRDGTEHAAYALDEAVARLRDDEPGDPQAWAPYVHIGP